MARRTITPALWYAWTNALAVCILAASGRKHYITLPERCVHMTWNSPFALPGRWLKGNLHTHTTQSDGLYSPEQAIAWYRSHGYDFLALTDHWILTPGQPLSDEFLTIAGTELNGASYHMLALGPRSLPDREIADQTQAVVDHILSEEGLAYAAHPYWTGQTSAALAELEGLAGLEVFNSVCEKMDGLGYARVHWDDLLASGVRCTGLAVDDVHWRHNAQGRGFVMVRAAEMSEESILDALRQGAFYASTGPLLADLSVVHLDDAGPALQVRCSPCQQITFYAAGPCGRRFHAPAGDTLKGAIYPLVAEQVYLRLECRDADGEIAWSNPVYVCDLLARNPAENHPMGA